MIIAIPDEQTLHDVARLPEAQHLHLVVDMWGRVFLTPQIFPGMWKIAVRDAERRAA